MRVHPKTCLRVIALESKTVETHTLKHHAHLAGELTGVWVAAMVCAVQRRVHPTNYPEVICFFGGKKHFWRVFECFFKKPRTAEVTHQEGMG